MTPTDFLQWSLGIFIAVATVMIAAMAVETIISIREDRKNRK